jgi:hypothetical protein
MTKILSNKSNIDLDYPICRPSLDLDFTQEVLDPRITFSRGSIGTRVNRNRLIETVSANQPRFDFDPVTGECKGLLIEETRTNLLTYSEDFTNANWSKSQSSIITTSIVAPNGSTAYKLVENTVSGVGHFINQGSITKLSNAILTFTIFAKAAERQYLGLVINSFSTGFVNRYGAEFNLGNGTVSEHDPAQSSYTNGSYSITPYPNGWYRCRITCTTSTDAQSQVRIFTFRDTNQWTSAGSYAGDGTSGFYIWGAQLEQGTTATLASFPTSYIPTDGTPGGKPRSADNASMTGTNFSSWYNQTEGTLFAKWSYPFTPSAFPGVANLQTSSATNNAITITTNRFNHNRFGSAGSNVRIFDIQNTKDLSPNFVALSAIAYITNTANTYISYSGTGDIGRVSKNVPIVSIDRLLIGNNQNGILSGHIRRITYYPKKLKDNQLQFLTA